MKNHHILICLFLLTIVLSCNGDNDSNSVLTIEPVNIGHSTIVFNYETRNRSINTEIYYPSTFTGDNVAIITGNYPIVIVGHGFLMDWNAYQSLWETLVQSGYIVCLPTTEMSLLPSHENFGEDLKLIASKMQSENQNVNSIFYNSVTTKTALLGHSMGGGAAFLGAQNNPNITTLVTFAAAETNPSAIASALNINIPSLVFSGEDDCVTPPNEHQNLMYDNLASACKTQINIINGGHCYFADSNISCDLGESFCSSNQNITREAQHDITYSFLKQWLDYTLNDNQEAFTLFNSNLQSSTLISYSQACN